MIKPVNILFFLSFLTVINYCSAERYIVPSKQDNLDEVFVQGASIMISNKDNSVLVYQTCETLDNNRATFYFVFSNRSDQSINLVFSNIRVTDQNGNPIRIIHKNELLDDKSSQTYWKSIASAFCTGLASANAQKAGRIDYNTQSYCSQNSNFNTRSSSGCSTNGSINGYNTTSTQGTIHCEALRQQTLGDVQIDAANRNNLIQANAEGWEFDIKNFYFDSTTVFPNTAYGSNFQIEVPDDIEENLEYLIITFDLGYETHDFYFYCGEKVKKWYHLGR